MNNVKSQIQFNMWENNPALVQLLGLCPLLSVSTTIINALGLGIATLLVLFFNNIIVSLIRNHIPKEIRIPIFVIIISSLVTCIQLLMNAYTYELYLSLGIFIPLIVTNCIIIARAETFASKHSVVAAAQDALGMGTGMGITLVLLGAIREIAGNGTIFDGANLLLGQWATPIKVEIFDFNANFLLALLPPGAFISMGFLIALKQATDKRFRNKDCKVKNPS
ncbi:electron transport complex protein [Candidatus Photodesmus blepharus]|uniref:Ion-translocating oxidoreductase complex subunit E n=1 Tax=Candidatus Photodesmus blepharonis TaxID=1179155 RepID=A0A084CN15_9GAMM|nr:electron transport complex subunit E [Candidatus Photodesmus blepharus]KEY91194.1 electron transport complex protein [Candidatus Photodesmus blepharus]